MTKMNSSAFLPHANAASATDAAQAETYFPTGMRLMAADSVSSPSER
jgi:hypothetical protein